MLDSKTVSHYKLVTSSAAQLCRSYTTLELTRAALECLPGGEPINSELHQVILHEISRTGFIVLNASELCANLSEFQATAARIARGLGNLMVQNDAGDTVVAVYDRDAGRIEDGARYHQTRQGGDIHTDSVNRPQPIRYLVLGCAAPALIGGETILVRADEVYLALQCQPDVLEILGHDFLFEGRGMAQEYALFQMPVCTTHEGRPRFRYLRSYITSAHNKAGTPLDPMQVHAFDMLDALLDSSRLQTRFNLGAGDILVTDDTAVFHGRTSFVDGKVPGAYAEQRHMLRYWID